MAFPQLTLRCRNQYDPLDRLINQIQPDSPVHQRFYCKSRLATEIQGATQHSIIQHDELLLAQRRRQGDLIDTTLLATDLQRSVLHTLKANQQRQPLAYSPYGHRPALSGLLSLLGFNGERPDPVTGHYLLGNGYRAFNPVLMRFNSPDSLSPFEEGGLNTYMYCSGDPVNYLDPTGHVKFLGPIFRSFSVRKKVLLSSFVVPAMNNPKIGQTSTMAKTINVKPQKFHTIETPLALSKTAPAKKYPTVNTNRTNQNAPMYEPKYRLPPDTRGDRTYAQFRADNEAFEREMEMYRAINGTEHKNAIKAMDVIDDAKLIRDSSSN